MTAFGIHMHITVGLQESSSPEERLASVGTGIMAFRYLQHVQQTENDST